MPCLPSLNYMQKIVAVTGASRGIGRALAIGLAKEGANLALNARNAQALQETAVLAQKAAPQGAACIWRQVCDIADQDQVHAWVAAALKHFGRIDVLINNAGILGRRAPIEAYPADTWRQVLDINLTGTFLMTQQILRQAMLPARCGLIINISSGVGRIGKAQWGAYAVSKFGCEGLSQVLAQEYTPLGIYSIAFNPNATRTAMRAQAYPNEDPKTLKSAHDLVAVFKHLILTANAAISGKSFNYEDFT